MDKDVNSKVTNMRPSTLIDLTKEIIIEKNSHSQTKKLKDKEKFTHAKPQEFKELTDFIVLNTSFTNKCSSNISGFLFQFPSHSQISIHGKHNL